MQNEKQLNKPKKGFKIYILRCPKCGNKMMRELRHKQKTLKATCSKCGKTLRMKVVGIVRKQYKRWNTMKIRFFSQNKAKFTRNLHERLSRGLLAEIKEHYGFSDKEFRDYTRELKDMWIREYKALKLKKQQKK